MTPYDRGWGLEVGYWYAPSAWGSNLRRAAQTPVNLILELTP
jgi:hypothetical protein